MTRSYLLDKKNYYEKLKTSLADRDFSEEIEAEIAEYRKKIEEKYEMERKTDIKKVDHYLELLDDLIEEATREEIEDSKDRSDVNYIHS